MTSTDPPISASSEPRAEETRAAWYARDREILRLSQSDPRGSLAEADRWLAQTSPGEEEEAWALRARAHALRALGAYAEALACSERAEAIFTRLGLDYEVARSAGGHVWALRYLGRYDEAVRIARAAHSFFRARGDRLEAAKQTLNLGTVYRRLGLLGNARHAYAAAAREFHQLGDSTLEATSISNLGNVLADLGRYVEAERCQQQAIRLYRQLGQTGQVARALLNLGLLLKRRGDFGRALKALLDSRALYEQLGMERGVALVDLDLAQTYLAINLLEEAAEASRRAAHGFPPNEMPYELGQALLWSAAVAQWCGDTPLATTRLAEAQRLFQQTRNQLWEATAAVLAASLGGPDATNLAAVAEAAARLERLGARGRAAEARLVEGELLQRLGRLSEASQRYRGALRTAGALGDDLLAYRARAALGQLLETTSPRQALQHFRAAIEHLEALRRRARADDLKLSLLADKVDVYERAAGLLLRGRASERRLARALEMIERGRAGSLLDDLLTQADHAGRAAAALARRVRDLRARLSDAYTQRGTASASDAAIERLEQEVAAATRQLQVTVRGEAAAVPFDLPRLRAALPSGAVLLEYYTLGTEVVCFVVDAERLHLRRGLASVSELEHLAERLRFHVGKGVYGAAYLEAKLAATRQGFDRVLGELWRLALAPLAADLQRARQLIVVPHGPLHGLPLHAAFDGSHYLAEQLPVAYAPSARVFALCSERPRATPRRPLFVGPRDEQLPWVAREVAMLARLFPEGEKLAGRRATLAALRRRAGRFDLLHLAAHGVFRTDNPNFSALKLADGWLSVADLAELSRGASLVTLSACETGLSGVAAGEELLGLTRAVLGAGAASLVASLWSVHDRATSRFMTAFYEGLRGGESKAASLQRAMAAVRRELDHPFFWAPFSLAGAV